MSKKVNVKVGDRVQHRAWFWYGEVTGIPAGDITSLSTITVQRDGEKTANNVWIPSIILTTEDFIYDWSDQIEAPKRKAKGKSKKLKHKSYDFSY